jgi:hypothetical protein|tara:strand:+ start:4280 stop:4768 length:489 start_codon:yes stop_codon:yes gene_type:complete
LTKKLEEEFNLPPIEKEEVKTELTMAPDEIQQVIATADKIDSALPQVTGLNSLDTDMDSYAQKAMDTFDDLVALGNNVEDRHAALIFDVASKMMNNAITAKTEKMNKKLKMIDLQLKKARLDRDGNGANGTVIHHDSEQITSDRNSMIESLKTIADSLKKDK